ncbi:hypothetical protein [Fulvivirga sp. M361]|nr:hypothetical protein [Fulvivirga sp. M361]
MIHLARELTVGGQGDEGDDQRIFRDACRSGAINTFEEGMICILFLVVFL